jgi:Arc/MetJ-type ribon-helix-helix transcriptional regulator
MKLSVSLSHEDVAFIDDYAAKANVPSRSAVLHRAVELLRAAELEDSYREAWDEWSAGEDAGWEATAADGLAAH